MAFIVLIIEINIGINKSVITERNVVVDSKKFSLTKRKHKTHNAMLKRKSKAKYFEAEKLAKLQHILETQNI